LKVSRTWNATAAVTGVLFALMLIFGAVAAMAPYDGIDLTTSSRDVARALVDGSDNLVTGGYVLMMSALLLIVFAGYLRHALGPADAWPATVGLGGGLVTAATVTVIGLLVISQGQILEYGSDTATAKTLLVLSWVSVSVAVPGLAAFAGGMSLASLSFATLPRWVGWLGMAAAALVVTLWVLGILVTLVWVMTVSGILVLREARATEPAESDADDG
jgi:hypothetical protein